MGNRAAAQNIEVSEPHKFLTRLVYQTNDPRSSILEDGYFINCQNYLAPGDEVTCCCMRDDATWDKADFEVVVSLHGNVIVQQITDWRHGGTQFLKDLKAEHKGFGKWNVTDQHGNVISSGISKAEASALVKGGSEAEAA
jgi:hypothetical protein